MGLFSTLFGKKETAMKVEPSTMKEMAQKDVVKMAKDPVCGMEVNEKTAAAKSEYMGKTYYFCSPACKKTFDANPTKYAGGGHEMAGHGGHTM